MHDVDVVTDEHVNDRDQVFLDPASQQFATQNLDKFGNALLRQQLWASFFDMVCAYVWVLVC